MRCAFAIPLLATALAGCGGGIPDMAYPGDPLFTVEGVVTSTGSYAVEAAFVWQLEGAPSMRAMELAARTGQRLTATASDFRLHVYEPPPPAAFRALLEGESRFARGNAAAIPLGIIDDEIDQAVAEENLAYGADVDHWVVFLEDEAPPGSITAWWLGAQEVGVAAGYHVVRVTPSDGPCLEDAELAPCVSALVSSFAVANEETARRFCRAPYTLDLEPGATLSIQLRTYDLPVSAACGSAGTPAP
jgi:hypothetical protein